MGQSSSYAAQNNFYKMGSKLIYPVALLFLFCLIHVSSSLVCFQCNAHEEAHCSDVYHEDDYMRAKDPTQLKQCPSDIENPLCRKMYQYKSGEERVIRDCGSVHDAIPDNGCYTTVLEGYNTEVCQCDNEDGCNSGNIFQVSTLAIVSATLLAYMIQ